jgi:dihydrofolate reductase
MPWHLSEDLKRFRKLTMGHHIVMGRKTWESIGRLLPGRKHIIISRKPGYDVPGATVVNSIDAAIAAARGDSEVFVIGGGEIYPLVLPIADRILATEIAREYEGDTFFPPFDPGKWVEVSREKGTNSGSLPHAFVIYERASVRR